LKKLAHLTHYDLLEVGVEATRQQVEEAYRRMMAVFDPDSPAIYSLYSEEERRDVIERIQEAYRILSTFRSRREYNQWLVEEGILPRLPRTLPDRETRPLSLVPRPAASDAVDVMAPPVDGELFTADGPLSGAALRRMRLGRGLSLDDLAQTLRITRAYLQAIEADDFDRLPPEVYLRGFVRAYARALKLDEDLWVGGYLTGYRRWREEQQSA
jgi:hypothetical protein